MKIIFSIFLALLYFLTLSIGNVAEAKLPAYRPDCVGIQGKFVAKNWTGGAIQVGCAGDNGAGLPANSPRRCDGEVQTVRPGKTFRLTQCSCFGKKGCLVVGKELKKTGKLNTKKEIVIVKKIQDTKAFKNNSCTINKTKNICGSNGQRIKGNVKIQCKVPPTPTPKPSLTPTPTPSPSICPVPDQVLNVKVTCPNCGPTPEEETISPEEE